MDRVELKDHPNRSGTTIQGWPSIALGALLIGVGAIVVLIGVLGMSDKSVPGEVLASMGAVFALAGVLFVVNAARGLLARQRKDAMADAVLADHPWNRTHATSNALGAAFQMAFGAAVIALFLVPFNWWAFVSKDGNLLVMLIVGLFDGVWAMTVSRALYLVARGLKYGTSTLTFDRFPYRLGQPLGARFDCARTIDSPQGIEVIARCVEEAFEVRGSGRNRKSVVVCYQTHAAQTIVQPGTSPSGGTSFTFTLDLPHGDHATKLAERPPRYWEVEMKAETPGVDFGALFLVPVY